ncbi:unnamed protein product [Tetraodon nigroviridis]|uniref:(spotted green pufferfish) hypothetical protein n=1 Tax=Tetraodon nigroviridis TaxID=99883 RepID=Q4RSM5_TETNG|nr:unnamed protein product [Tetraodon nigroviridis]
MSRLSDSGYEEDLSPSPSPSPVQMEVFAPRPHAGQLSPWYLQYGDIGYRIQKEKEAHFHPSRSLARQPQLTAEARCTLVSWLISLHKHLRLSFECCCLAVNIVDRFLTCTPVAADCFQLVGAAALLLASKQVSVCRTRAARGPPLTPPSWPVQVEVCSPRISHLLSFCCDAFTREQLCNLECLVLLRLNFRLDAPTLAFFLDYYTSRLAAAPGTGFPCKPLDSRLAQKVCELSLADYAFNGYPPSVIAGSALWLALDLDENQGVQRSLALECKDKLKLLTKLDKTHAQGKSGNRRRGQVTGCDEDHHFGDYALDFIADSPSTLESSLSPAELVPFHGCIIPPLTPQWDTPAEDAGLSCPSTDQEKGGQPSRALAPEAPRVHFAPGDTGQRHPEGTDLQERNVHLRQLAKRAKHLASVLEVRICWTATSLQSVCVSVSDSFRFLPGDDDRNREGADAAAGRRTLAQSLQAAAAGRGLRDRVLGLRGGHAERCQHALQCCPAHLRHHEAAGVGGRTRARSLLRPADVFLQPQRQPGDGRSRGGRQRLVLQNCRQGTRHHKDSGVSPRAHLHRQDAGRRLPLPLASQPQLRPRRPHPMVFPMSIQDEGSVWVGADC